MVSIYPRVFKKADLVKMLPGVIVKELKKNTNVDSYSDIRDVVSTTVRKHTSAATLMDVDTHIMSIEKGKSYEESEEYEYNWKKITTTSSAATKTRKVDPYETLKRDPKEDCRPQASRSRMGNATEHAATAGRRVTEAETAGANGAKVMAKANRQEKEDTPRASTDTKAATMTTTATTTTPVIRNHLHYSRTRVYRNQGEGNRLMTTSWTGHVGNLGGAVLSRYE